MPSPNEQKPNKPKPHDVLAAADKVSSVPNGRARMIAIFDTVAEQIKTDLQAMKNAATKEDAIAIIQATYDEYQHKKDQVIDKLDRVVK